MNFILLSPGYFGFSVHIIESCSIIKLLLWIDLIFSDLILKLCYAVMQEHLGYIQFYHATEAKPFSVFHPTFHELWNFLLWLMKQKLFLALYPFWALFPLIILDDYFSSLSSFSHMHWSILRGRFDGDLQISEVLSLQLSPFISLASLTSSDSQLYLSDAESTLCLPAFLFHELQLRR